MPKARLEFELPEDDGEFMCAVHGAEYKTVLREIDRELRSKIKHDDMTELQWVRDFLHQLLLAYSLTLD